MRKPLKITDDKLLKTKTVQLINRVSILFFILLPILSCSSSSPDQAFKHEENAEKFLKEKKYDEAITEFTKGIDLFKSLSDQSGQKMPIGELLKLRGYAYVKTKKYDLALKDFSPLSDIGFSKKWLDDYRPEFGFGIALFEKGDYKKSIEMLNGATSKISNRKRDNEWKKWDYFSPDDHIMAYEYLVKAYEKMEDTKNLKDRKKSLENIKKEYGKN